MLDFKSFPAWLPAPGRAPEVADVPYDVVDTAEARALVRGRPHSILRVTRPDVELPDDVSMYSEAAYARAAESFRALLDDGLIVPAPAPALYLYAQQMGAHRQVGVVGVVDVADYAAGRIKRHEHTRRVKEDDRVRHLEAVGAHLGPVFLTYRAAPEIDAILSRLTALPPTVDYAAPDNVRHTIWPVEAASDVSALETAFGAVPALYIADGHHRAAAAARVGLSAPQGDPARRFLAVAFADHQLNILPYHRVVRDLAGHDPVAFLAAVAERFAVTPLEGAEQPLARGAFAMLLRGEGGRAAWYRLTAPAGIGGDDPVASLDVSVLQDRLLGPLLGIEDPRTDERIDFVGGIRGLGELERRVASGAAVAFALYPTTMAELLAIADAGEVMPPKSTWFEPKLRSGLVIHRFR